MCFSVTVSILWKCWKMFQNIIKHLFYRLLAYSNVFHQIGCWISNISSHILDNFINQFSEAWRVLRISPIPKTVQSVLLKNYRSVSSLPKFCQFYQFYQKFMKGLFWNKLPNLLKRNLCTINTSLVTLKITLLQHYSPNCTMT